MTPPVKQPVVLRIYKGDQLFLVKQFAEGQIVIGRQAENQVALPSDRVAPLHASIEERNGTYFVSDLGSETGTKRNGSSVLESALESGDVLEVGEYRVEFYIGAPKPKAISVVPGPHEIAVTTVTQSKGVEVSVSATSQHSQNHRQQEEPEQKKPEIKLEQKPTVETKPIIPEKPMSSPTPLKTPAKVASVAASFAAVSASVKLPAPKGGKAKKKKTFAPPSKHADVKDYVKPSKGTVVEVLVAWRERVISSQHFSEAKTYTYGSDTFADVLIPVGSKSKVPFLKIEGRAIVMIPGEMVLGELVRAGQSGTTLADLIRQNKMVRGASGYELGLEQGEMLKVNLNDQIVLIIRYVSDAPKPLMAPMFDLTASEAVGVIMAFVITGVMFLYTFLYTPPRPLDDLVNEDQLRRAVIIIPTPKPPPVKIEEPTPPPVVKMTPSPTKKETKPAQQAKTDVFEKKDPGAASNPAPTDKKKPKQFTSVKQGGQVKTGNTEGAQMKSKDVTKSKIFSVFGGGGRQDELAQGTSGQGELAGLANAASGKAGNAHDKPGQGIGTPFKDTGGGGTGTAQFGVPGVKTHGRGGGNSGYGEGGLGGRKGVSITPGGLGESFSGTIDREAIRRVIRENINAIRSCYERELNRNPDLQGKILISWDIGERGRVMRGKVAANDTGNAAVANCVLDRIRTYTFPEPPTSAEVTVIFPFYFKN